MTSCEKLCLDVMQLQSELNHLIFLDIFFQKCLFTRSVEMSKINHDINQDNVICVENIEQLEERLVKNTTNNSNALIELVNEKSS